MLRERRLRKLRHGAQSNVRAEELDHARARLTGRTIDGDEASTYCVAGTTQYPINTDIACAPRKRVEVAGDEGFLHRYGAGILFETAYFWWDLGFSSEHRSGRFCISRATGPDEDTTVVDDKCFTNLMARGSLRHATDTAASLAREHPETFAELKRRAGLPAGEPLMWQDAAGRMYLPWDKRLPIHSQKDSLLDLGRWAFSTITICSRLVTAHSQSAFSRSLPVRSAMPQGPRLLPLPRDGERLRHRWQRHAWRAHHWNWGHVAHADPRL